MREVVCRRGPHYVVRTWKWHPYEATAKGMSMDPKAKLMAFVLLSCLVMSPVVGFAAGTDCDGTEVPLEAGTLDNFELPFEPTFPDANLNLFVVSVYGATLRAFDQPGTDLVTAHTFEWTASSVCGATLSIHLRSEGAGAWNDRLSLELRDEVLQEGGEVWRWVQLLTTLTGTQWGYGTTATLTLNLGNLPVDLYGRSAVLIHMLDGNLDVLVDDDTVVDHIALNVCTGCTVAVEEQTWGAMKTLYRD